MSNSNPPPVNPSSAQYESGFRTGCLIGCAPLAIFLVLLVMFTIVGMGFRSVDDSEEAVVIVLPEIAGTAAEETLLPSVQVAPKSSIYLGDDLSCVPVLSLESTEQASREEWTKRKAHVVAAALHLNQKEQDGYLKALLRTRPDLVGLPFVMGNACRTTGEDAQAFKAAADAVRLHAGAALVEDPDPYENGIRKRAVDDRARMAVATQVIPAEVATNQWTLIRGLASIPRPEATRRLAHLAIYSPDQTVRNAALEALAVRREEEATEVLSAALQYPWPAVADNAATAIVQLKRTDLIPQLEAVLAAPDPRAPKVETVAGREETVAYELVRVNHLHNCLLCHAPIERDATADILMAEVPVPTMPLPNTDSGYGQTDSNLLIRVDVTYLRQDFSALLNVNDWSIQSWPTRQRFDFLLRRRVLSPEEADDLRERLAGESPYQRSAARALNALTGKDVPLNAVR